MGSCCAGSRQASPLPPVSRTEPCRGVGSVPPLPPFLSFRAAPVVLPQGQGQHRGQTWGLTARTPCTSSFAVRGQHPHFAEGRTLGLGSLPLSCQPLEAPAAPSSPWGCRAPGWPQLCPDPSKLPAFVSLKLFGGSRVLLCLQLSVYLEKDNAIVGEDNENIKCLEFSVTILTNFFFFFLNGYFLGKPQQDLVGSGRGVKHKSSPPRSAQTDPYFSPAAGR